MPEFPSLPILGGLSRRQVLKNAGTGFGYLALAGLLIAPMFGRVIGRSAPASRAG